MMENLISKYWVIIMRNNKLLKSSSSKNSNMYAYAMRKTGRKSGSKVNSSLLMLESSQMLTSIPYRCLDGTTLWISLRHPRFIYAYINKIFWLETTTFSSHMHTVLYFSYRNQKNQFWSHLKFFISPIIVRYN